MILDNIADGAKKLSKFVQNSASDLKKNSGKNLKRVTKESSQAINNLTIQARKRVSDTAKTISNKTR
jgi:hypothetical protein